MWRPGRNATQQLPRTWTKAKDTDSLIANDCFLMAQLPKRFLNVLQGQNPNDYQEIEQRQMTDQILQQLHANDAATYPRQLFGNHQFLCNQSSARDAQLAYLYSWDLLTEEIDWYHSVLIHNGTERFYQSINLYFYHPQLMERVES